MPRPSGEHFPKSARLRKRGDYLRVQRQGNRIQSQAFVAILKVTDHAESRLGITTTKRLGGAVVRNRFRRLVREAFRRNILVLPDGVDVVVIVKNKATLLETSREIFDDLSRLSRRLTKAVEQML